MNSGAFGENFPYSNFHDLNMDWIIKIAKDFLDQYTNIQQTIADGLTDLEEKKTELEGLLDQWYETHSSDIANQLASSLQEIRVKLNVALRDFETSADAKTAECLAQIPEDYTTLANIVATLNTALSDIATINYSKNRFNPNGNLTNGYYLGEQGQLIQSNNWTISDYCYVPGFSNVVCWYKTTGYLNTMAFTCAYDANKNFLSYLGNGGTLALPSNTAYIRFCFGLAVNPNNLMLEYGTTPTTYEEYSKEASVKNISAVRNSNTYEAVTLSMTPNKLLYENTGAVADFASELYSVSDMMDTEPNMEYMLLTGMNYGHAVCAWYTISGDFISSINAPGDAGASVTYFYAEHIKAPENAYKMRIAHFNTPPVPFPFLMRGNTEEIVPEKRWTNRKWTDIGDSLTDSYTKTGAHYFDYIKNITGITHINKGLSGTGYAQSTDNYMTRALTVDPDSDVVTIFGSGNDASSGKQLGTATDTGTNTIAGCINTTIDNIFSINPIMPLGIVTPTPWQGNMPYNNGWMEQYANLIVEICRRRSIPCLDLFHCSNLNPNSEQVRNLAYSRDNGNGVHPNELGHALIAPKFQAFLETILLH